MAFRKGHDTLRNMIKTVVILVFAILVISTTKAKQQSLPTIGYIRNSDDFDNNAGCSLWVSMDQSNDVNRHVFLSDFDGHARMNIGGRDIALILKKSSELKELKVGDRETHRYVGNGVEVVVDYVVTHVCAPDDESCEVWSINAGVLARNASGKQSVRAHGICGT